MKVFQPASQCDDNKWDTSDAYSLMGFELWYISTAKTEQSTEVSKLFFTVDWVTSFITEWQMCLKCYLNSIC